MDEELQVDEQLAEPAAEKPKEKSYSQSDLERIVEERLIRERKAQEKSLKGIDLDEARALLEKRDADILERQKERGEFESVLKQTVEKKDAEINAYKSKLEQTLVDGALLNAASQNNAVEPQQVGQLLRGRVKLTDDGAVEVLDDNGSTRYNDSGSLLTVNELVGDFLTANPHFVRAGVGGAGSQGNAGGTTQKPVSYADMVETWNSGGKEAFAATKKNRK